MQWKFTPGMIILALVFFVVSPAVAQVNTDTVPAPSATDTTAVIKDTLPTSIDPQLLELSNARVPKEYKLVNIRITGTTYL